MLDRQHRRPCLLPPDEAGRGAELSHRDVSRQAGADLVGGQDPERPGRGTHVILDDTYRVVRRFPAGNGLNSDLHEFLITDRNTALISAWEYTEADLTAFGGKRNGLVVNGIVQELELPTGRVLFEWKSLDHVHSDESLRRRRTVIRLLPHQLDRARRRRQLSHLGAQHMGHLQDRRRDRQGASGASAASAATSRWARARSSPTSTTRGCIPATCSASTTTAARPRCSRSRRRSCCTSTPSGSGRRCTAAMSTIRRRSRARPAARRSCRTETCSSAGAPRRFSRSTPRRTRRLRRDAPEGRPALPHPPVSLDGHAVLPSGGRGNAARRRPSAARELERRDRGRSVAARDGPVSRPAHVDRSVPKTSFETRIEVPAGTKYARVAALDADGKVLRHSEAVPLT